MRILHTSDWHLGAVTGCASRLREHQAFLSWLTGLLAERQVDALVVAGDVFDSMQPSAEAQGTWYRFLAGLCATGVREVVVVGGNHDSPSRLDAPRDVLAVLDVHVVGGLPPADLPLDVAIVPLRCRGSDEVAATCLAVPYVHEYRLGVRTTEADRAAVAEAFRVRFAELYTRLADRALALHPGLPVVATGHLALGSPLRADYGDEIHQVGFIGALPATVLDPRVAYAALGHIHRAYPVEDGRAWYSGSPIPISVTEAAVTRRVLLVDVPETGRASVEAVAVPVFRELRLVEGPPEEVERELRCMASGAPLPPLVHVAAHLVGPEPGLRDRLVAALAAHPEASRPVLVEIKEVFVGAVEEVPPAPTAALADLSMADVFARLCLARRVGYGDELQRAFATLSSWREEELQSEIDRIDASAGGAP